MARGRFGRRRRPGGSLTALIHSLYQQQQAEEDRVMFDAYQNGGHGLDGKPVTDSKMRAYIATRRNGFSKDDPLYKEWDNRLTQLDFKIGEEKIGLAYKEGKVGPGAVAAFYREQLRKIPKDSEFYRDVAGRAADWAKAGAAAARGRARSRLTSALQGKSDSVQKTWGNYSALVGRLTEAAKRAGLIFGNQELTDADATDLQAFLNSGAGGTGITMSDWKQATLAAYRGFDTLISVNKQLNRGTKELTQQKQKFLDQNLVRINTVDDRAKYEIAYESFKTAIQSADGDPRAMLDAAAAYTKTLTGIKDVAMKDTGLNETDPEFIGGLTNEITALTTGKSPGPNVFDLQSTSTEAVRTSDNDSTAESILKAQDQVKKLDSGQAFFGQAQFGGKLEVIDTPLLGLDASSQQAIISVNGVPTAVYLKGQPIQAVGLKDANGNAVTEVNDGQGHKIRVEDLTPEQVQYLVQQQGYQATDDSKTVGYVFQNGTKTTFGVIQADGSMVFTETNPFHSISANGNNLQVVGASANNPNTMEVVPNFTMPTVRGGQSLLADESITPKDLLNLAATTDDANTAALLTAEASKRTSEAKAEADYMARARGKALDEGGPESSTVTVNGKSYRMVNGLLAEVQAVVSNLASNYDTRSESILAQPPQLPSLYNQPAVAAVPKVGNATPQTFAPPPSPAGPPPGKAKDDLALPKPPSPPNANKEGAKAQGGKDDIYIPPPPKPSTSGGSGGEHKYAL